MSEETIQDRIARRQAKLDEAKREEANLQALATLIKNNGHDRGPVRVTFMEPVREVLVGIGKDHTARIMLFEDDIAALRHLLGQETTNES